MSLQFYTKTARAFLCTGLNNAVKENVTKPFKVFLYTGAPGEAGTANKATENTGKVFEMEHAENATFINSKFAVEWVGVKAKETYKWVGVWNEAGTVYHYGIELEKPVEVEVGDTFRIPSFGGIFVEVLAE